MTKSTPSRSGGGATMNKNVRTPIRGGSPQQRNHTPNVAASVGRIVGDHVDGAESGGRNTTKRPNERYSVEVAAPVRNGNDPALTLNTGPKGQGRQVHRSGSQGRH
jgi:hypothetical protein